MRIVQAEGGSVRNVVALVRRRLGLRVDTSRAVHDEDSGDGLHRVELEDGTVVEAVVRPRWPCRIVGGID